MRFHTNEDAIEPGNSQDTSLDNVLDGSMTFLFNDSDELVHEPLVGVADDNINDDIEPLGAIANLPESATEARKRKRMAVNLRAHQKTIKSCHSMANHYNKRLKASPDFSVGDMVSILIPNIERSPKDLPRLPGVILKVNGITDISYKIGTIYGILSKSYRAGDLQSYNGYLVANTEKTITLRKAVRLTNPQNKFTRSFCKCKANCKTNKCTCKKNGISCSTHCHLSHKCNNN